MVQLSAAGLGVNTSNVNATLADAITQMTQGFVQGAKLKMMREQADRETEAADRLKAQDAATARAYKILGEAQNWNGGQGIGPPAPQEHGPLAQEPGSDLVLPKPAVQEPSPIGPPVGELQEPPAPQTQGPELPPDAIAAGAMKSSMPLGQALDYRSLQEHQKSLMAMILPELGKMDPREAAMVRQAMLDGFKQDAELLDRSHAVSEAHDFIVNGGLDVLDGAGNPIRDPALVKQVMEMAQEAEAGLIPTSVLRQKLEQYGDLAHASYIETHQRLARADQAKKEIQDRISNGGWAPDAAVGAERRFRIGKYDKKQFEEDWPHLLNDEVKYKGEWFDRGTAEQMKKADIAESKYNLEVAQLKKQLAEFQAQNAPKAAELESSKASADIEESKARAQSLRSQGDKAILEAMVTSNKAALAEGRPPVYSKDELDEVSARIKQLGGVPTATTDNAAARPAGPETTTNRGNPDEVNAEGASVQGFADSFKGQSRADVVSRLAELRASGRITDEQGKAIIAAMGGLPSPDVAQADPNYKPTPSISDSGKVDTSAIEADRQRLVNSDSLPPDQGREVEKDIMKKYGLNRGELYAFKKGTLRPGSGVMK